MVVVEVRQGTLGMDVAEVRRRTTRRRRRRRRRWSDIKSNNPHRLGKNVKKGSKVD